jgi:[ribosomal protein S5]-alanine N-acetyltransferase
MAGLLPNEMPVINRPPVVLRAFRHEDVGLVQSVAGDPLIPLITTVPLAATRAMPARISNGSMNV